MLEASNYAVSTAKARAVSAVRATGAAPTAAGIAAVDLAVASAACVVVGSEHHVSHECLGAIVHSVYRRSAKAQTLGLTHAVTNYYSLQTR